MHAADAAKAASAPTANGRANSYYDILDFGLRHRPPPRSLFKPMPRSGPWHLMQIKRICRAATARREFWMLDRSARLTTTQSFGGICEVAYLRRRERRKDPRSNLSPQTNW